MNRPHDGKEPDPRIVYADIIDLPHWESPVRPRMSLLSRAAQFAPFAALSGYDDIIREEARETGVWAEPGESRKEEISRLLAELSSTLSRGSRPVVRVTHFVPDAKKDGGSCETAAGTLRKIDPAGREIALTESRSGQELRICIDRITDLSVP